MPPSVAPNGWFDITSGLNYDCADDEGEDYCVQFQERGKENLTELDKRVAQDSLENDPYTAETKWMLRGRLYKKLDDNPDLQDSLEVIAVLYDELQSSITADFKEIDDEQATLFDMDSTAMMQLKEYHAQIDSLRTMVQDGLEQLNDSTMNATQRQVLMDGITAYRESIRNLSALNATTLQEASASKSMAAEALKAANSVVIPSAVIEANQKETNEIYLATIGKDTDAFTAEQTTALLDIASQCPMLGGNTVFKARSLYWLIDDSYDFDDAALCLPYGIIVKRLAVSEPKAVMMVPNPAMNEATLVFAIALDAPGVLIMYDAIGTEVLRSRIPPETLRFTINTTSLPPALYHYKILSRSEVLGNEKLTIIH